MSTFDDGRYRIQYRYKFNNSMETHGFPRARTLRTIAKHLEHGNGFGSKPKFHGRVITSEHWELLKKCAVLGNELDQLKTELDQLETKVKNRSPKRK